MKLLNFSQVTVSLILFVYLFFYLLFGIYDLTKVAYNNTQSKLFEDFNIYEKALLIALQNGDPYSGTGYLYPPSAFFIVELFNTSEPASIKESIRLPFKVSLYLTTNIFLLGLIVYGVMRYYSYNIEQVWYWFIICFGFGPFLELLLIGQINVITLFGIFLLFIATNRKPFVSGIGLALAILTKVSPLLFYAYLISTRKWRVVLISTITIIVITFLSALRYGITSVLEYPSFFQEMLNSFILDKNSQSFVAKLANLQDLFNQFFTIQIPILDYLVKYHNITHRVLTFYILILIFISGLLVFLGKQENEPLFIVIGIGMTLTPNIMWYHHYVFLLLPILIWMGWSRLHTKVVIWCLIGLLVIQVDRFFPPYGLLVHIFGHISLLAIVYRQAYTFFKKSNSTDKIISSPKVA